MQLSVQVYLAEWNQTLVAVKLLLSLETTATMGDVQAVANMVLSSDNPVLSNLEQARKGCCRGCQLWGTRAIVAVTA